MIFSGISELERGLKLWLNTSTLRDTTVKVNEMEIRGTSVGRFIDLRLPSVEVNTVTVWGGHLLIVHRCVGATGHQS